MNFKGLTRNSFLLACASLFGDISTEMLYPVLPIYLTQTMGATGGIIGIIEGIAQAAQNIIQGFSGYLSDKLGKRKVIVVTGSALSALSKPFIGLSSAWQGVLGARLTDRLGSGIRSAPRDALIASSVEPQYRGKAFGLEGFGDNLGAFIGPLFTVMLFFFYHLEIRTIFYLSLIPGLFAVGTFLLIREEKKSADIAPKVELKFHHFPSHYWKYLFITAVFGIGNSSNAFLILQLKEQGLSLVLTVFIYALYNLVAALVSYPAGALSDRYGNKVILLASFFVFLITYSGFALAHGMASLALLFIFYGFYQGMFRSIGKSYATSLVPKHLQASGVGWYSTVVGLSGLIASSVAGQLWDKVGHAWVFYYAAITTVAGIVGLVLWMPKHVSRNHPRD